MLLQKTVQCLTFCSWPRSFVVVSSLSVGSVTGEVRSPSTVYQLNSERVTSTKRKRFKPGDLARYL